MSSSRSALKRLVGIPVIVTLAALPVALFQCGGTVAASAQAIEQSKDDAKEKEKKEEPKKKVQGLPLKPDRTIEFSTDEGTWLSLDVAPDGKTILSQFIGLEKRSGEFAKFLDEGLDKWQAMHGSNVSKVDHEPIR